MLKRFTSRQFIVLALFLFIHLLSFCQGKIIVNGATIKVENGAYIVTKDVSLTGASTLNINNSTIKVADSILNNSGTVDVTNGTVEMNGTVPQFIPAGVFSTNKIRNLVISSNVTLMGEDSVTNVLSFGGSNRNFATGNFLTLKSTALNTARLADITNGGLNSNNTITGNVHVERYISATRAWRLLTAPINSVGAQTINQAWQENVANPGLAYATNQNPKPGFGMHITGGTSANGFDQGVNANSALKKYSGGAWIALPNTKPTLITSENGFMVFFRGNRSTNLSMGTYAPVTSTVLRSTGTLKTNDQSYQVTDTGFTLIGNPYASPINLNSIAKTNSINIQDNFYLWDPKLTGSNGVGGYVNISWDDVDNKYDITPLGAGTSGLNQYIQSGSAFFARTADDSEPGTLVIRETDKVGNTISANRGANSATGKLRTNLYSYNADGTLSLVDGTLNSFGEMYSNSVDKNDAVKIKNTNESLFTVRDGVSLVVERKQLATQADTIFLNMLKMQAKTYKFEVIAENFNTDGLTAFLEDNFTNIHTALNLSGTTTYNYTVVNVPGSWNASRFSIVFKQVTVLPVTLSSIKAFAQNNNIMVQWKVDNELNIKQYEVERSADGFKFTKTITKPANGNSSNTLNYSWLDDAPLKGNNYYRIKSTGINGEISYSSVVKVFMGTQKSGITLTNNIIVNNTFSLQMNNMPAGAYSTSVINAIGQVLYTTKINHQGGSSTWEVQLVKHLPKGIYNLEIVKPGGGATSMKLLMQ